MSFIISFTDYKTISPILAPTTRSLVRRAYDLTIGRRFEQNEKFIALKQRAHDAVTEFQLAARDIIIEKVKIERDEVKKKCFCAELVHSIQELVEWILTDNDINTRVGLVDFLTKRACTSASNEFDRHSIFNDADHPFFPSARRFGDRSGR